jgi:ferredoxin
MKGVICYYSGTGNTVLACQYIVNHLENAEIELFDIVTDGQPDFAAYDLVGFAAFADFLLPSPLYRKFMEGLQPQDDKPAFVFNTYGMNSGKTLKIMAEAVSAAGFKVLAGYSLHVPENYPPMIANGLGNEKAPNDKELAAFKRFVAELDETFGRLAKGEKVPAKAIEIGTKDKLMPKYPKGMAKRMMGEKFFDKDLCTTCGTCANVCPNGAIVIDGGPVFDEDKCSYCWACYNNCLFEAIYTKKYRGKAHYSGPSAALAEKLR